MSLPLLMCSPTLRIYERVVALGYREEFWNLGIELQGLPAEMKSFIEKPQRLTEDGKSGHG